MNRQRQCNTQAVQHQRGAVAIIVAICLALLVGMLGLVLDLGHLYVAKTELQNAADAAALSGAKELDGTVDGVNAAKDRAIEASGKNNYDLNAKTVVIDAGDMRFSSTPDGPWVGFAEAQASPSDKTFLEVDTGNRDFNTWFVHVLPGMTSLMQTFGLAVAGYYVVEVAPLGICAVDKDRPEDGFIRGVSYNVPLLNPLVVNPDPMWINPVAAPPEDTCDDVDPQWNSRDKMAAFVCTGKSSVIRQLPGEVYVNTGGDTALGKELNSRFDDYQGSKCDVASAPPDENVHEYQYDKTAANGGPKAWMEPLANNIPTQQGITIINRKPVDKTAIGATRTPPASVQYSDYGLLWASAREKNFATGGDHTLDDWTSLYKGMADQTASGYPSPKPAATSPPYAQKSGSKYFTAPPKHPTLGVSDRRVLNLVVIDCSVPAVNQVGPGNKCAALPTLAVGKFFMTVPADLPKKELYVEFVRMLPTPLPPADVKLYQ